MKGLIVDDEEDICKRLQSELKKEGFEAEYTTSPVGVIKRLHNAKRKEKPYELLLLDLKMPKVGGFELLKEIREARLDMDVVVITGYGDEEKAMEAIRLGAVDYLRKPISLEELNTAIFRVQQKRTIEAKQALRHSILVVDDEKDVCTRIKRELDKEGYQTAVAYDGVEGLDYFKNYRVDVVIADIRMPKMDGLEMLKACREITDNFVSIIITGHGDHETAIEALKLGVSNYLRKPISSEELVVSVNKGIDLLLLRRGLSARRRELEIETALKEQYAKNLEKMVKERTFELDQILNTTAGGIRVVDHDFNVIRMNDVLAKMSGVSKEDSLGRKCYEVFGGERCHTEGCPLAQILKGRTYLEDEIENYRIDGSKVPCWIVAKPYRGRDSELLGIIEDFRDITERKRAEDEKAILQEQLRQSQKMEAIGLLAGGIAHDFNNILTIIKGYFQLSLLELKEGDPLWGNLNEIKKAADRASDLIRKILAFSRRQVMEMKVLDLNTTLKDLEKMLCRVIGEDIELVTHLADDLGRVKADPGQIEQVIMNLAVNARDAMPLGGKLTIETANVELDEHYAKAHVYVIPGHYVMVSVSDTGVGMTPEIKERVFEPFFTTKERGEGTGLGLSTVYGIVKQGGGYIWVDSEPGKGATFKIYIPRVDEPLDLLKKKVVEEKLLRGSETILVVEDEEEVRKLAVRILQRQGYRVLEAPQGVDALLICEQHKGPIHLLVGDVVMPKMNGRELAERLVSIRPEIKVLYMSGYADNVIAQHGVLEEGINYIQKPFTVNGLARKVREVLDGQ
ncbi:MAG: response regulator [Thermodesulfobacteriota bacterium]